MVQLLFLCFFLAHKPCLNVTAKEKSLTNSLLKHKFMTLHKKVTLGSKHRVVFPLSKFGPVCGQHIFWEVKQGCWPPLSGTPEGTLSPALHAWLHSITSLPQFRPVLMHLELLALTYWLNFITACYYKSKLLGWPQDEKANQYSQYLPPLISVACVSPAICNRS